MMKLNYSTSINAPAMLVWNAMTSSDIYNKWASAFSAGSTFKGEWEEGGELDFFDPDIGGTRVVLDVYQPYTHILVRHIAILSKDFVADIDSDPAKTWVGSIEEYIFTEEDGVTKLEIHMQTHPDFEDMFNDHWPKALAKLKEVCELVK